MNFWQVVSRFILKQRIFILIVLAAITVFLGSKIQNIQFSHSEANLLPRDHEENIKYDHFLEIFGEEGNMIIIAVQDSSLFHVENFNKWNEFSHKLDSFPEVDFSISVGDIQKLKKDKKNQKFYVEPIYEGKPTT
ncbi:MAG: RND family transporter, partial [Lutimonas sp.]